MDRSIGTLDFGPVIHFRVYFQEDHRCGEEADQIFSKRVVESSVQLYCLLPFSKFCDMQKKISRLVGCFLDFSQISRITSFTDRNEGEGGEDVTPANVTSRLLIEK